MKRVPFDQLQDQAQGAVGFFEPVDLGDVRMIQRSEQLGFALESGEALRVVCEKVRRELESHVALELRVMRAEHHTHAAFTQR